MPIERGVRSLLTLLQTNILSRNPETGTVAVGHSRPSSAAGIVFVFALLGCSVASAQTARFSYVRTVGSGFNQPGDMAIDGNGNIFVADSRNQLVKEIVAVNGAVSSNSQVITIASGFNWPDAIALDVHGNLFVANDKGDTLIVRPGRECKLARRNTLDDGAGSTPMFDGRTLFLRAGEALYAIGVPGSLSGNELFRKSIPAPATRGEMRPPVANANDQ